MLFRSPRSLKYASHHSFPSLADHPTVGAPVVPPHLAHFDHPALLRALSCDRGAGSEDLGRIRLGREGGGEEGVLWERRRGTGDESGGGSGGDDGGCGGWVIGGGSAGQQGE